MNIFEAIVLYLLSKPSLTALVSQNIFPEYSSEQTGRPFIVYKCHDIEREVHLHGASAHGDFYFIFEIYSDSSQGRNTVGEALRNILHGRLNTTLKDSHGNTCNMEWSELKRDVLGMQSPKDGTESSIFSRIMSFRMVIKEPLPTLS